MTLSRLLRAPTQIFDHPRIQTGHRNYGAKRLRQLAMVPKGVEKKRKREEPDSEGEDQTAALLKGFESSGEEEVFGDEGFKQGHDVPALPDSEKLNKKLKLANKQGEGVGSGVVYVGYVDLESKCTPTKADINGQTHTPWLLRTRDAGIFLSIRGDPPAAAVPKPQNRSIETLRLH